MTASKQTQSMIVRWHRHKIRLFRESDIAPKLMRSPGVAALSSPKSIRFCIAGAAGASLPSRAPASPGNAPPGLLTGVLPGVLTGDAASGLTGARSAGKPSAGGAGESAHGSCSSVALLKISRPAMPPCRSTIPALHSSVVRVPGPFGHLSEMTLTT